MSFARAKITRFNEKHGPGTGATAAKSETPRSQIPKMSKSYGVTGTPRGLDAASRTKPDSQRKTGCNAEPCSQNANNLTVLTENSMAGDAEGPDLESSEAQKHSSTYNSRQDSIVSKTSSSGIPMLTTNSKSSKSSRKPARSLSVGSSNKPSPTRNSVEYQFLSKKKRLELLKRELEAKQKPILDLYHSLLELKRKLEMSGMVVPLDAIKIIDFDGMLASSEDQCAELLDLTEEQAMIAVEKNAEYLRTLEGELDPVPMTFSELGKYLMSTREKLIEHLTKLKNGEIDKDESNLEAFEQETKQLNGLINDAIERQETRVKRILADAQALTESNNLVAANQVIRHLETKLKEANESLLEVTEELERTQRRLDDIKCGQLRDLTDENCTLKERVKSLEAELQSKKKRLADNTQTNKSYEQKIDLLNKQVHELDKGKKEAENKVTDMNLALRNLQTKLKNTEQKWREEKEEILKNHKGEHAILEKLTAERQALDTRVHLMNTILDEQKRTNEEEQGRLKKEIALLKENLHTAGIEKQIIEDKMESMKQEVAQLSVQQQQAIELMKNSMAEAEEKRIDDSCVSEREAQLRTELLAMKVALKAAQERIENYTTEKMRFIDSIERLNGDGNSTKESLGKALVQKEEQITCLEQEKSEAFKIIEQQKMQISQLSAKVDNFQAGVVINHLDTVPRDTQELKAMLEEGKAKLQKALAKSLDNEQKLIKYEHDINQHKKQLNDMENLLKVRDGLIGMLKAKKDELLLENESLHKYSEEVRQLLFDTKEELKQKSDVIHELSGNLDSKSRLCVKLEKKVKDLESTLSETNEKRFKLQESVGSMEKELQTTKAHMNQIADLQTRYDLDMTNNKVNSFLDEDNSAYGDYYNVYNALLPDEETCSIITSGSSNITRQLYQHDGGDQSTSSSPRQYQGHDSDDSDKTDDFNESPEARQSSFASKLASIQRYTLPPLRENEDLIEKNGKHTKSLVSRAEGDFYPVGGRYPSPNNLEFPCKNLKHMYYYVKVPQNDFQTYAKYIGKMTPLSCAPIYRYYYRVFDKNALTRSLVNFEPPKKVSGNRLGSYPIIQRSTKTNRNPYQPASEHFNFQRNKKTKLADDQVSDSNLTFLVYPKSDTNFSSEVMSNASTAKDDPYKICCDILQEENRMVSSANLDTMTDTLPESKIRERQEFIEIVSKLCKYDKRGQEKLGLGKEFTPILFGGVSKYKVMDKGSLVWCRPSQEMQMNNMLITSDIQAQTNQSSDDSQSKSSALDKSM